MVLLLREENVHEYGVRADYNSLLSFESQLFQAMTNYSIQKTFLREYYFDLTEYFPVLQVCAI